MERRKRKKKEKEERESPFFKIPQFPTFLFRPRLLFLIPIESLIRLRKQITHFMTTMGDSGGVDGKLNDSSEMDLLGKIVMLGILGLFCIAFFFLFLHLYKKISWLSSSENSTVLTVRRRRRAPTDFAPTHIASANRIGLDPSTFKAIPVLVYNPKDFKDGIECVVCLSELAAGDKIRLLQTCKHGFHVGCIDMWLQSHSTCPVCRNPLSTTSKPIKDEPVLDQSEESTTEIQELPTNVLFWGDETCGER